MSLWLINTLLACLVSAVFTSVLIPKILLVSFRRRLFDPVDSRKIHQGIIPRLGGIAFMPSIFFTILLLVGINTAFAQGELWRNIQDNITEISFTCCALLLLYLTGIIDDMIGVRYKNKFVIQILCGILLISAGLALHDLYGVFGIQVLYKLLGFILTILVIVFIVNAINLIDGIDGLASGLSIVAMGYYGILFIQGHQLVYAVLSFATVGTLLPFFYYNVFGNVNRGRKLFMGDTGSLTLGLILAFCSLRIANSASMLSAEANPMVAAFAPLLIPCMDVVRVFFFRIRSGKNPFTPDKNHIHHKMLAIGMPARWAMITIVLISALLTAANVLLMRWVNSNILLVCDVALYTVFNLWLSWRRKMRESQIVLSSER